MDIRAIIFDNDGVLVDSEIIHIAVEREVLAEFGLTYSDETYKSRFVGLSMPDYLAEIDADHRAVSGQALPAEFVSQLRARGWPRIQAESQAMAGAADLLRAFDGPYAVASSAPLERLRIKLTLTELIHFFGPHIYSAEQVENGKPAPDLFLHAAQQLWQSGFQRD